MTSPAKSFQGMPILTEAALVRASYRGKRDSGDRLNVLGFRCALSLPLKFSIRLGWRRAPGTSAVGAAAVGCNAILGGGAHQSAARSIAERAGC